jgi:hypothetical protein
MGGAEMHVHTDVKRGKAVGSVLRLSGRVFGMRLFVEEVVAHYEPFTRKEWTTIGVPQLVVIGRYTMGFELEPLAMSCRLRVYLNYELPQSGVKRLLGCVLAGYYAKWCIRQMLASARRQFGVPREESQLRAMT